MPNAALGIGVLAPMMENIETGEKTAWGEVMAFARQAEESGFDTVWTVDELLWSHPTWPGPRGFWECVSMTGAIAAATSTIGVGTGVLSALHRNPAVAVKIAETVDEISGGRLLFGVGAGHNGSQAAAFGFPGDYTVSRYEEALEIVVAALRGSVVSFEGRYHRADGLEIRPRGPRPGRIPLMLAGNGPRTMRLAARHADIWSGFSFERLPEAFVPMLERLDAACIEVGRDAETLGRSLSVTVEPGGDQRAEALGFGVPIAGSPAEIATALNRCAEIGATRVDVFLWPCTRKTLDTLATAVEMLRS